jgi:hypothetical protein
MSTKLLAVKSVAPRGNRMIKLMRKISCFAFPVLWQVRKTVEPEPKRKPESGAHNSINEDYYWYEAMAEQRGKEY